MDNNAISKTFGDFEVRYLITDLSNSFMELFYLGDLIYSNNRGVQEIKNLEMYKSLPQDEKRKYYISFFDNATNTIQLLEENDALSLSIIAIFGTILKTFAKEIEESQVDFPEYIQKMIDAGILYKDGRRVINTLEDVANFMVKKLNIDISAKFLMETFLQDDYSPYSKSSARNALHLSK